MLGFHSTVPLSVNLGNELLVKDEKKVCKYPQNSLKLRLGAKTNLVESRQIVYLLGQLGDDAGLLGTYYILNSVDHHLDLNINVVDVLVIFDQVLIKRLLVDGEHFNIVQACATATATAIFFMVVVAVLLEVVIGATTSTEIG